MKRTARILSFRVSVSKTSVWKIKKFEEELPIAKKKARNLVALDETVVKARKKCCVYSAVDVERDELVLMIHNKEPGNKVVEEAKYCQNKPKFIVEVPWLISALEALLDSKQCFGKRSKVESVFSLKQRLKIFFAQLAVQTL